MDHDYESACRQAVLYKQHMPLHIVLASQTLIGILTLGVCLYALAFESQRIHFHPNVRVLIISCFICCGTQGAFMSIAQGIHVWKYWFTVEPCDSVVSVQFCLAVRSVPTFCISFYCSLHLGIALERLVAMCINPKVYEKQPPALSLAYVTISLVVNICIATYLFHKEHFKGYRVYCGIVTSRTIVAIRRGISLMIFTEILTLIIYLILKRDYSLASSWAIRESQSVLSMFSSLLSFHFISQFVFILAMLATDRAGEVISELTQRTIFAALNFYVYYGLLAPLLLICIIRRRRRHFSERIRKEIRQRDHSPLVVQETYFDTYDKQWN